MAEIPSSQPDKHPETGEQIDTLRVTSLCEAGIRANEDTILVERALKRFGVFDGVSSLTSYMDEHGKTGGFIASHTAAEIFRQNTNPGLKTLFKEANHAIEALYETAGIDTSDAIHRFGTTVAAVQIWDDTVEMLQCADSVVITIDKQGRAHVPLDYHDQDLPAMLEWQRLIRSGVPLDDVAARIRPMTIDTRRQVNVTFGTLNGDPRAENFALHTVLPRRNIAHILLLTDGMYIPKENPAAAENWQQYADIYLHGGLDELFATVRSMEASDPDCIRYPRYKLHDDASGVAIAL